MEKEKIYQFYALSASDDPQNYRYVGTTSTSINARFSQHKYCATHPEKCSLPVHKWMASVYQKGGTILYTKIDECLEKDWEQKEITLIQEYKEKYKLLNLDKGGRGVITKEKRSKSGIERSAEAHYKKIVLFDKIGTLIEVCESVKYACEKYNLPSSAVGNVLSGRSKTSKGYFIIEYDKYIQPDFDIKKHIQDKINSTKKYKLVYQYDLSGNLITCFKSRLNAQKEGFDPGAIYRAIKNKTPYKNSYWTNTTTIDISKFKSIYKYLYKGVKYTTLQEIANVTGLANCTISAAFREQKLLKGFLISRI